MLGVSHEKNWGQQIQRSHEGAGLRVSETSRGHGVAAVCREWWESQSSGWGGGGAVGRRGARTQEFRLAVQWEPLRVLSREVQDAIFISK